LLENLLQWSSSQRGSICFKPEVLNMSELVNKELMNLRQQAFRKEIIIDLNIEGAEKTAEADPDLILP
jgi:hypothetical protein